MKWFVPVTVAAVLLSLNVSAQEAKTVPGEYIVKYKSSSGGAAAVRGKLQGKAVLKNAFPSMNMYHVSVKTTNRSGEEETVNLEALRQDPDVAYVEPNYIFDKNEVEEMGAPLGQSLTPTAAELEQYSYSQSSSPTGGVTEAWKVLSPLSNNNGKIVVAIVDTGLDANHHVFAPYAEDANGKSVGGTGALWVNEVEAAGQPYVDDDGNGFVDDIHGWNFITNNNNFADDDNHGTHVAGIVVGAGLNIFATELQESKIVVMPLKFLNNKGSGTTANAVKAIDYAVRNGARVINNSWGGASYSRALHEALTFAYNNSVLIVSAAGNYSSNNDASPMYPANYDVPSNIAIASTSSTDQLSYFSNYGATTVQVGSPGEWIRSTIRGDNYGWMSGTSMASPFVSGMAALALREAPYLTGFQMKQLIMQEADYVQKLTGKVSTSARISSMELISQAKVMSASSSYQPDYNPVYSREPSSVGGGAAGCGLVTTAITNGPGKGGPASGAGVLAGLLMIPLIVWFALRRTADGRSRRKHERFRMNSEIRVKVGDRELLGHTNTISEGGLSFNVDEALEKGGLVTMRIQSPDGHEAIEVTGQVVWSEANQAYGVQFANAREGTLAMIKQWTQSLIKSN